ncbi:hypothetical protein [Liquorilactobacillus nagelii]
MTNGKEQVQLKYHFYPAIFNLKIIHHFGGTVAGNHCNLAISPSN